MAARTLAQKIFGGKPVDPKEQAKQWRLKIKGEMRQLQRQIDTIDREEKKILKEIKKLAKEGQMDAVRTLAHAVSDSRKGKHRILMAKTGLNSMEMQIGQQMAMMRVGQALEKSSEIMAIMNKAVKLDAIGQTMRELAKEMETAGIIDELVDEAFADMDDEDAEEEGHFAIEQVLATCLASLTHYSMHTGGIALLGMGADEEHIEQVMAELGLEAAGELPLAKTTEPARAPGRAEPAQVPAQEEREDDEDEEEDEEDMSAMQARIAALRAA